MASLSVLAASISLRLTNGSASAFVPYRFGVIVSSYLDTAVVAGSLLRAPELVERWAEPSALASFRVSGLAGHVGLAVFRVVDSLDSAVPDEPPVDAVEYFRVSYEPGRPAHEEVNTRIRQVSEEFAGAGPLDLADRFDVALAALRVALPRRAPDQLVFGIRRVMRLDQWLVTRMIELAVHVDDLAVSLGVPTPGISAEAADLVITTLARTAIAHHGALSVLRALSRRERAPEFVGVF